MSINILQTIETKLGNTVELVTANEKLTGDTTLIIGVFHGDEPQGKYLIDKYLSLYSDKYINATNTTLFIPCFNPDGMQLSQRTNANGVDLNRNFPTKNWGEDTSKAGSDPANYFGGKSAASEIETKFLVNILEQYKPKLIISLHAPYKIVNYDGPGEDIAQKISDIIGYPVEASIGYPTPGSFGTYCGVERNIPTITLELDEEIPVKELEQPVFEIFDKVM